MISIQDVSKTYGDIKAVDHVSLDIADGEIFGIVGYSGAGKSTLIRMIDKLETVDSGAIYIDDEDITKLKGQALRVKRRDIGMIFQHFNLLWSKSVLENIAFPLKLAKVDKKERLKRAKEMAENLGIADKLDAYPSALSGGQKQRVAIARALVLRPKILLCDEATSSLDPKTTEDILDLLASINRDYGLTIVMITHQMENVQKICHKSAVMANGQVVEVGSVEEVFSNPKADLTKNLVQTVDTGLDVKRMAESLKRRYPEGHLLRLSFTDSTSERPIIYEVMEAVAVPLNIVSANIKTTQFGPLGVMYIHVAKRHDIAKVIDAFNGRGVKVEVV